MQLTLFLFAPLTSAWVVPTTTIRSRTTTTSHLSMNIFADFFKTPTYKKKDPVVKEEDEPVVAVKEESVRIPDVQELETQKAELTALQTGAPKEVKVPDEARTEPEPLAEIAAAQVETAVQKEPAAPKEPVAAQATQRIHGTVEWFSVPKGYGFIKPDDIGQENIFVHYSAIEMDGFRKLRQGEPVSFVVQQDENGRLKAMNVILTSLEKATE